MIKKDLETIYQPLIGMTFEATYHGTFEMPQTENIREILEIGKQNPFAATLQAISSAVRGKQNEYGAHVWKGITGPDDGYTDYWLWAETGFSGGLIQGAKYEFMIQNVSVFQCVGVFSYGVSTNVTVKLNAI